MAATQLRLGGVWKEISGARVFASGAWRTINAIKVYSGGAWRDVASFAPPMTIALSPTAVTRIGSTSSMISSSCTATPTGGLAAYTYSWARVSGSTLITIAAPTSASTYFAVGSMVVSETRNATFRCTCTDSLGSTATADVSVTFTRTASGGGGGVGGDL